MVAGALLGVVLLVARVAGRRRQRAAVPGVSVAESPRAWAGPARLNGSPTLRLPRCVPTPAEQIEMLPGPAIAEECPDA
jgi:hypothetical protein